VKILHQQLLLVFLLTISLGRLGAAGKPVYAPTWDSLRRHETPAWLDDAKFGIYCHWGLRTVQLLPENAGKSYREVIPAFTAEKFDPAAWADLFVKAGAEFAGPVAWHSSGYVHWDSRLTEWNSMNMSPHRDISGELTKAVRARGLKVLMSFHTGYHYSFPHSSGNPEYTNPAYTGLYGPVHDADKAEVFKGAGSGQWDKQVRFPDADMQSTVALMKEAVSRYDPDIVWVDTSFGGTTGPANRGRYRNGRIVEGADSYLPGLREREQRDFLSFFFNQSAKSGRPVEFVYKTWDVPPGIGMRDVENGLLDELAYDPWMTDIDMDVHVKGEHLWFFRQGNPIKPAGYLINLLADIVSKNGRMLLNVPPRADGTFSPEIERELLAIGSWLSTNGEAIHGASPWFIFGEGPTVLKKTGHYSDTPFDNNFVAGDVRYTVKGDSLFAIMLGWPGDTATFHALGSRGRLFAGDIVDVSLLGQAVPLEWSQGPDSLVVKLPAKPVAPFAQVLRIRLR